MTSHSTKPEPMADLRERVSAFQMTPAVSQSQIESPPMQNQHAEPQELDEQARNLPIVIPQTASKLNAFDSPFMRCYPQSLRYKDIDQPTFLAFIDGLNECFISNPAFKSLGIAGKVMQQFYSIHPVQYAGIGLEAGAGLVGSAVSYGRTRAYMKAINVDLFHPAGLSCTILKAKKMTEKIGFPTQKIEQISFDLEHVPSKQERKDGVTYDSTLKDRMRALDGHVASLDTRVPEAESPDNLLKRLGASQAKRANRKQNRKSDKKLAKTKRRLDKADRRVVRQERKMESKVAELQNEFNEKMINAEREKASTNDEAIVANIDRTLELEKKRIDGEMDAVLQKGEGKIEKRQGKADAKLKKLEKKETKSMNKMRWIVITPWHGDEDDSESDEEEREAELDSDSDE